MAKITVTPEVQHQLHDLLEVLVNKHYFSFLENAEAYVDALVDFMHTIPNQQIKATNSTYAQWYCSFRPNKQTQWFMLFDIDDDHYIIKKIFNSYSKDYPELIRSI